jgi:hypothetical protein
MSDMFSYGFDDPVKKRSPLHVENHEKSILKSLFKIRLRSSMATHIHIHIYTSCSGTVINPLIYRD